MACTVAPAGFFPGSGVVGAGFEVHVQVVVFLGMAAHLAVCLFYPTPAAD